uniref:copper resistance protein B n=1 Tax=uncultured Erythrobacter sp. TaxID=263913 RepID=UPI002606AEAB|nr:copper resistance protein B [uncultured Erythrobacter sp.]
MRALCLISAAIVATPLSAQNHSGHGQHGSADKAAAPTVDHCAMGHLPPEQCPPKSVEAPDRPMDHSKMDHSKMEHSRPINSPEPVAVDKEMDHAKMGHGSHGSHGSQDAQTDKSARGAAPEDAVPARAFEGPRHAADSIWGAQAMEPSREQLARENGDMRTSMILIERLEARLPTSGGDIGYVWDMQAFYGGDINRFVIKTEGEGEFGGALEDAEIQALFSHAIGPFFDLQAGARVDLEPETRSHLVIGVQGLSPYMFHVDGAAFLSDKGDLTARIEGEYDQRITQDLIVQPRVEIELAAQDIPERGIGAGLTKIETGLRLRYEIEREFAPYIGIEYEAKTGRTANIARAGGDDPQGFKLIAGIRAWF